MSIKNRTLQQLTCIKTTRKYLMIFGAILIVLIIYKNTITKVNLNIIELKTQNANDLNGHISGLIDNILYEIQKNKKIISKYKYPYIFLLNTICSINSNKFNSLNHAIHLAEQYQIQIPTKLHDEYKRIFENYAIKSIPQVTTNFLDDVNKFSNICFLASEFAKQSFYTTINEAHNTLYKSINCLLLASKYSDIPLLIELNDELKLMNCKIYKQKSIMGYSLGLMNNTLNSPPDKLYFDRNMQNNFFYENLRRKLYKNGTLYINAIRNHAEGNASLFEIIFNETLSKLYNKNKYICNDLSHQWDDFYKTFSKLLLFKKNKKSTDDTIQRLSKVLNRLNYHKYKQHISFLRNAIFLTPSKSIINKTLMNFEFYKLTLLQYDILEYIILNSREKLYNAFIADKKAFDIIRINIPQHPEAISLRRNSQYSIVINITMSTVAYFLLSFLVLSINEFKTETKFIKRSDLSNNGVLQHIYSFNKISHIACIFIDYLLPIIIGLFSITIYIIYIF